MAARPVNPLLEPFVKKPTRMVVLDDDPTGIQTVYDCLLITKWDVNTLRYAFCDSVPFFYILTNTRAMTPSQAHQVVSEVMEAVVRVNRDFGYRLIVVSRSDSCLRGHFPLETDVIRHVLESHGLRVEPRTIFCPAFIEAGRVTIDGVHYMRDGSRLVPVSETEFARDNVFPFHTSVLSKYIAEKGDDPRRYVIVNAESYAELYHFAQTLPCRSNLVIRSSSSLPKVLADLPDKPLLNRQMLGVDSGVGCFVVGSHVAKTTRQLQHLLAADGVGAVEVSVQRILDDPDGLLRDTLSAISAIVNAGCTPVVFTSRQEVRLPDVNERQLLGQRVSNFLVEVVRRMDFTPAYLVAKGGITSHDILTTGLGVVEARVLGQVATGVPCIMTDLCPYVIFPGNVGDDLALLDVYLKLREN